MKEKVILDTNLLLLLAVGVYKPDYIRLHKRTDTFSADDFEVLLLRLQNSDIAVTPNIATEASNLLWQTKDPHKREIRQVLCELVSNFAEHYVKSRDIVVVNEYKALGLTDCGILELVQGSGTILTVDLDLYLAAQQRGIPVENFNHSYRMSGW